MNETTRSTRHAIYQRFAATGCPPSPAELAAAVHVEAAEVQRALQALHDAHAVVLTSAGDAVRMAHPFSSTPMGFVVSASGAGPSGYEGDRMWWGGCAWDSFGIGAALGEKVSISTRCPHCHRAVHTIGGPGNPPADELAVRVPRAARAWWDDVIDTCSNLRLFCTAQHAHAWAEMGNRQTGAIVPAQTMWRLAESWYGDRLSPTWSPRPRKQAQQLLSAVGLHGAFWALP